MATRPHLRQFENFLVEWKQLDFEKVFRKELGTASFESIIPLIKSIETKFERTEKIKEQLSDNLLKQFYTPINQIIAHLKQAIAYNDVQFVAQKDTIYNQINSYNEQILNVWPQIVALLNDNDNKVEIENTLLEIKKLKSKTIEDAKNVEDLKESLTNDLSTFEERYKNEIFNKAELIKQEDAFSEDAKQFKKISYLWLYGIIGTSILLLIFLFLIFKKFCFEIVCFENVCEFNFDEICEDCNRTILYLEIFKSVTYRLFLISFFSYIISICIKNYNANMHNYTVNKHKANSLSAALILLEKSKTNEGNDQIMTQAVNAIFSHQPTGFNNKSPENLNTAIIDKITDKFKL